MAITHKQSRSVVDGADAPTTLTKEITGSVEANVSQSIPDDTTDLLIPWLIDIDTLVSLHISSDQDIVLETNNPGGSSAAPSETLSVKANQPVQWTTDDVMTNPITGDVTALYASNSSGTAANLEIRALMS